MSDYNFYIKVSLQISLFSNSILQKVYIEDIFSIICFNTWKSYNIFNESKIKRNQMTNNNFYVKVSPQISP